MLDRAAWMDVTIGEAMVLLEKEKERLWEVAKRQRYRGPAARQRADEAYEGAESSYGTLCRLVARLPPLNKEKE